MGFENLKSRVVTGASLGGAFAAICILSWYLPFLTWALWLLAGGVVAIVAHEFSLFASQSELRDRAGRQWGYFAAVVAPAVFGSVFAAGSSSGSVPSGLGFACVAIISFLVATFSVVSSARTDIDEAERTAKDLPMAIGLIGMCGGALPLLVMSPNGGGLALWLVLIVSINDTAAYFFGSFLRGPKLSPVISPNKTISGSFFGILVGSGVGILAGQLVPEVGTWPSLGLCAFAVIVAAQLGDLAKSYLKRIHGVKDTGSILPGHGGLLDRVDGILAGAPVLLCAIL